MKENRCLANHLGGVGELGSVVNHHVAQPGTIGGVVNHHMGDAAPPPCSIVNPDLRTHLRKQEEILAEALGVRLYPGRVLGGTKPGDPVQFNELLRPNWFWITTHYELIKLSHSRDVVWDDSFDTTAAILEDCPHLDLSTFFWGEDADRVRPDRNRFEVTQMMNEKNAFIHLCRKLGVPVPDTVTFADKDDVQCCGDFAFPSYVKISRSVSGLGTVGVSDRDSLESELTDLASGLPFQVQKEIRADAIICVRYHVGADGKLRRNYISENRMDGVVYDGSMYPTQHNIWHVTDKIALYLYRCGMKGHFSFDVLGHKGNGRWQYYVLECNPREGGSTYPARIANKLGARAWLSDTYKTSFDHLESLDLGELTFNAKTGRGVAVMNWGIVGDHKLGCVCMGNTLEEAKGVDRILREYLLIQ